MAKTKYYFYYVDFRTEKYNLVHGHTVASSEKDAVRRIKTAYKVTEVVKVWKSSNMEFDTPKTNGIA